MAVTVAVVTTDWPRHQTISDRKMAFFNVIFDAVVITTGGLATADLASFMSQVADLFAIDRIEAMVSGNAAFGNTLLPERQVIDWDEPNQAFVFNTFVGATDRVLLSDADPTGTGSVAPSFTGMMIGT